MTALSTKFRLALLNVGEYLTENDVQNLAFLCEGIKPARRELLRNARELFVELQGRDLLNERNVGVLSGWLEGLNLLDAMRPLKEYSDKFLQGITDQQERCIEHEDLILKYYCVTCDSKVCSDCAFNLHDKSSHDVIKISDVRNESNERRKKLEREVVALRKRSEDIKKNWREKKDFFSKCRENIRKEVQKDTILIHEKAEKNKLILLKQLDEKEISDCEVLMKEKEEIEHVINKVGNLEREMHEVWSDSLSDLRMLSKAKRKCTEMQNRLDQQQIVVKKKVVKLLYKKVPNDGACGILTSCSLVGGVSASQNQVIHVFDERQGSGGLRFICIDPIDPNKEYWRYLVTVIDHLSPAVISGRTLHYDHKNIFVSAVGRTVFQVSFHWTGSMYDSLESVSPIIIDDLDEGSWITSITGCNTPGNEDENKFVISINNSSILREYHVSGEALRKIDTKDYASSIIGVAYKGNIFGIISRGSDNVILITADSQVKQIGSLRPPSSSSGCLLPICVIWTGASWLVLFVNNEKEKEWKVVNYKETGQLIKICSKGISCDDMDAPVSVTRFRNTGFVSFADNTIKFFEH